MILFHHKASSPKPNFAAWLYAALVAVFALVVHYQTIVGLTGLGVTLLLAGVLVELNAPRIWEESLQWRKKSRKQLAWYHRPTQLYYVLNVWVLWPVVILLGIASLLIAYHLA